MDVMEGEMLRKTTLLIDSTCVFLMLFLFSISLIELGWIGGTIVAVVYISLGAGALYESFLLPMANPVAPKMASPFLYDLITGLWPGHDAESLTSITEKVGIRDGMSVLEIGTGTGWFSIGIAQMMNLKIDAVDTCEKMLKRARERAMRLKVGVNFHLETAEDLKFKDSTFDVVCSVYCMNVVRDRDRVLKEMVRVTKPSGKVAIYVPKPLMSHMLNRENYAEKLSDLGLKDVRADDINLTSLLIYGNK